MHIGLTHDGTNYERILDKPFSCDVEGCSMKFINEDHLTVHKKRHGMVLNLGLGHKGNIFADQTPTPTSFIRNCEEVGLFQDLQNVNPFEETFKKAAEAAKTGQTPCLDRPFQSNPPDDTLHTPNVFPHITDLTCIPNPETCIPSETLTNQAISSKEDVTGNIETPVIEKVPLATTEEIGNSHKKRKNDLEEPIVLQVPNNHLVQLVTPDNLPTETPFNMVILNTEDSVKDKLRKSINEKPTTVTTELLPLKVPIPKITVNNTNFTDKFATFSKNSLKLMGKPKNGIFDLSAKRRKKKDNNFVQKETRSEFLARNRAAATRCREKKKVYIWNLENLNRELTLTNQNLQLLNMELKSQLLNIQKELLRHKSCNVTDSTTEALINKIPVNVKEGKSTSVKKVLREEKSLTQIDNNNKEINDTVIFDFVEVTLNENEEEKIPLVEKNTQEIINLNTNNVNNNDNMKKDFTNEFPTNHLLFKNLDNLGQSFKQVYHEHCYFAKEVTIDVNKGVFNCRTKILGPDLVCQNSGGDVNKITNNTVLLNSRTPPPLILLKPFKKRNLLSESTEKS